MGLSNYERNQKVVWAVHHITELGKKIDIKEYPCDNYKELKNHCENLWFELWGKSGNSAFWLFGSESEVQSDSESIWSLAMYGKIAYADKEEKSYAKSILTDYCEFEDILSCINKRDEIVYRIYEWVQQIQYATNRYEDELSEAYKPLMCLCSKIYGQCFTIFNESQSYALAYLMNKIAEGLYKKCEPSEKETWDAVTKYLVEDRAHHEIRNPFKHLACAYKIEAAKKMWKSLYETDTLENRMFQFLEMSGEHYKHKWDKVFTLVTTHEWDEKKFEELMNKNINQKKQSEKNKIKEWEKDRDYYTKELLGIKNR